MKSNLNTNTINKEKMLRDTYKHVLEVGFADGSLDLLPQLFKEDIMGIGSAADEIYFSIKEIRELIVNQRKQSKSFDDYYIKSNPVFIKILEGGTTAIVIDIAELTTIVNGKENKLSPRMTMVFEFVNESWNVIHWHASISEHISAGEDPWHIEEWKQKTEKLERMVEEKTAELLNKNRELEIEAALERVRTQAMAMNSSEDLSLTIDHFFYELKSLNINPIRCGVGIKDGESRSVNVTVTSATGSGEDIKLTGKLRLGGHPILDKVYEALQLQAEYFPVIRGDEINEYYQAMNPDIEFPNYSKDDVQYGYYFNFLEGGLFAWTEKELLEDDINIFRRFKSVLSLTYRRYLDLKEAEAQTREAQIEASLERVRARTMAMQKSDELKEVIQLLYEQFVHLKINVEHTGFIIDYKERDDLHIWLADQREIPFEITIPCFDSIPNNSIKEAKEKGKNFFSYHLTFEEKNKFYQDLFKYIPGVPEESLQYYFNCPGLAGSGVLLENVGLYIENFSATPYTDDENKTLMRFGKAFQQTYTRFLDLKKAEAQARESQIEVALERVRAKAMSMQKSDELSEAAALLYKELQSLGVSNFFNCGYVLVDEENNVQNAWMTHKDGTIREVHQMPLTGDEIMDERYKMWNKKVPIFHQTVGGERLKKHNAFVTGQSDFNKPINAIIDLPDPTVFYFGNFSEGYLHILAEEEFSSESEEILSRFTSVFEITFRRFLDLQKAEAQAREAQIEAALERVRSLAVGMQKSDEVGKVSDALFKELQKLSMKVFGCTITVIDEAEDKMELWRARPTALINAFEKTSFKYSMQVLKENMREWYPSFIKAWKSRQKYLITEHSNTERNQLFNAIAKQYNYKEEQKAKLLNSIPEEVVSHFLFFKIGYLALLTKERLSDNELSIARRFIEVFDFTYTRFYDLKKAEAQNKIIQAENERKTQELEEARKLQLAMLPSQLPKLSKLDIAVYMQTATEVGGDYYDFSRKDDGSLNICLGDATGHGLKAGTLVSMMKSLFVSDSVRLGFQEFFNSSNETLKKMSLTQMMMAFAMVNIYGDEIKICNAGVPPIYIYRKNLNEVEEVDLHEMPIGALKNTKYEVYRSKISKGDAILMLSDGMPELQNQNNEMYGYERLQRVFKQNSDKTSEKIISQLKNESDSWQGEIEPDDDITFVVIKVK